MRLRLPLQSGSSVLPLLLLGVACGGSALMAIVMLIVVITVPGEGVVPAVLLPSLFVLVFGAVTLMVLRRAYARRASDLLIEDGVLRIEGGPHDGFRFTPAEIDPYGCRTLELDDEYKQNREGDRIHTRVLRVSLREGRDLDLAQSWEVDERASLASIAETLAAMAPGATSAVASGPPDVVRCEACGAPMPAADAEHAQCPYCGVEGSLPESLRGRVREALMLASHRRETSRVIETLLAQPSAQRMNVALVVTIALSLTAVPLGWALGPLVAIGALILAASVTFAMIAERRAYRVVSCDLAASGDGHERRCRLCQAPLPEVSEVLVRCMYCAADNIVAYDLRRPLEHVDEAPIDIDAVLARRGRERLQHAVVAAFAVVWMLAGVMWKALG
jgi:hypothetical protein